MKSKNSNPSDSIDIAFDQLLSSAMAEYVSKQKFFQTKIQAYSSWRTSDSLDRLTLSSDYLDDLDFNLAPIASYVVSAGQWAWAQSMNTWPEHIRANAFDARAFALKTGYRIFETPFFEVTLSDIDELCALALSEQKGRAIFKDKGEERWVFYVVI